MSSAATVAASESTRRSARAGAGASPASGGRVWYGAESSDSLRDMRSPVSLARLVSVCAGRVPRGLQRGGRRPHPRPDPARRAGRQSSCPPTWPSGQNRFLFTLLDARSGRTVAVRTPRVTWTSSTSRALDTFAVAEGDGAFVWADPDREGVFVVSVELSARGRGRPSPGRGCAGSTRVTFDVPRRRRPRGIGRRRLRRATRTLATSPGRSGLTSDPAPRCAASTGRRSPRRSASPSRSWWCSGARGTAPAPGAAHARRGQAGGRRRPPI